MFHLTRARRATHGLHLGSGVCTRSLLFFSLYGSFEKTSGDHSLYSTKYRLLARELVGQYGCIPSSPRCPTLCGTLRTRHLDISFCVMKFLNRDAFHICPLTLPNLKLDTHDTSKYTLEARITTQSAYREP